MRDGKFGMLGDEVFKKYVEELAGYALQKAKDMGSENPLADVYEAAAALQEAVRKMLGLYVILVDAKFAELGDMLMEREAERTAERAGEAPSGEEG